MDNTRRAILIVVGIVAVLVLMVLVSRVGGIAIRSDFTNATLTSLTVSSPAVRGVPVRVQWETDVGDAVSVLALWRDASGDQVVGVGELQERGMRVEFPCESASTAGSLVIIDRETQTVLGQVEAALLAAGADCALR